jgi:hypothetical protein
VCRSRRTWGGSAAPPPPSSSHPWTIPTIKPHTHTHTQKTQNIEKKGVLSAVEKAGLLSKAEQAGLTLSTIEKLGLLSTAERLGLLEAAEGALVADPGKIAAASIAPLVATVGVLALFPDDNAALAVVKYALAAVLGGAFLTLFAGGFVVASLQE